MKNLDWLSRTELLIGKAGIEKLQNANILVVGLGGVGSYCAEFIARAGIGKMTIVDGDIVDPTNRNRQLPALHSTQGTYKADWMYNRINDINPEIDLKEIKTFLSPEEAHRIVTSEKYDFVVDAIDSITPKLNLLTAAYRNHVNIIMSGGAGGKTDVTKITITDIAKTHDCFFVRTVRKRLKKEKIYKGIPVVFSPELQDKNTLIRTDGSNYKKSAYGTISYMPAAFGGACANFVIQSLLKQK